MPEHQNLAGLHVWQKDILWPCRIIWPTRLAHLIHDAQDAGIGPAEFAEAFTRADPHGARPQEPLQNLATVENESQAGAHCLKLFDPAGATH